jgi:hypothetical protein
MSAATAKGAARGLRDGGQTKTAAHGETAEMEDLQEFLRGAEASIWRLKQAVAQYEALMVRIRSVANQIERRVRVALESVGDEP